MSFEGNKIAAAVLVALIIAMVSGILADHLVEPHMLAKNVYQVAVTGEASPTPTPTQAVGPEPIGPLLAGANADAGKNDTKVCQACHTFDKGQPNRIGPNLYGIVGDEIAHDRGNYDFSTALKTAGAGKTWTPDLLNDWLFKPQLFARGTKMTFIGVPKVRERADIIAYLNSLSDSPKPLASAAPAPAPAPASGAKAPATAAKPAASATASPGAAPASGGK